MRKHREHLQTLNGPEKVYLGYQLLPGSLLSQLQAVSTNIYQTKLIKPGQYSSRSSKKRSTVRKESETASKQDERTPAGKQRRRNQITKSTPTQILCQACGNSNVPLIQGGRYCRPCVDSGKTNDNASQTTSQMAVDSSQPPPQIVAAKPPVFIHSNYSSQLQPDGSA